MPISGKKHGLFKKIVNKEQICSPLSCHQQKTVLASIGEISLQLKFPKIPGTLSLCMDNIGKTGLQLKFPKIPGTLSLCMDNIGKTGLQLKFPKIPGTLILCMDNIGKTGLQLKFMRYWHLKETNRYPRAKKQKGNALHHTSIYPIGNFLEVTWRNPSITMQITAV